MREEYIAFRNPFTREEAAMLHAAMDLETEVCAKYMEESGQKGKIDLNEVCRSIKKKLEWLDEPERNIPYVFELTDNEYRIFLSGLSRMERLPQNESDTDFMQSFLLLHRKLSALKKNITSDKLEREPARTAEKKKYFGIIILQPCAVDEDGIRTFESTIKAALEPFHPDMGFIKGQDNSYTACISYVAGDVEPVFRDLVGQLAIHGLFPVFSISEIRSVFDQD